MIIFDNIIFSLQKRGGISVVWYEILSRILQKKNIKKKFIEYGNTSENIFRRNLNISFEEIFQRSLYLIKIRRFFNPKLLALTDKFIFHSSYYRICNNKNAINITTVHDFTYEYYFKGIRKFIHVWQKHRAIKRSDYIICVSENTKKDLLYFIRGINPNNIRVIYNGVSDDYFPLICENEDSLPFSSGSYVLFVGARGGYKNFDIALRAVSKSAYNFIIVGEKLSRSEIKLLDIYIIKGQYVCLENISNNDLNILYNNAFCLLYPSAYEGFGIPVLESQKAGCPVIAYNRSSIPEIIGKTPLLLNELSVEAIVDCFKQIEEPELRKRIIQTGFDNCKQYTWNKMYTQVKEVYKEVWTAYR